MSKYKSNNAQEFLKSFFSKEEKREVKEVNGFVLVKTIHGVTGQIVIMVYTKESFKKYQDYNDLSLEQKHFFSIINEE